MGVEFVLEPGWQQHLDAPIAELFEHLGAEVEDDAYTRCPKRTGHLADSIYHRIEGAGMDAVLIVGAHADYAADVELGHHIVAWGHETGEFQPPDPFLRPALYRTRL